jgi:hypothetical protein
MIAKLLLPALVLAQGQSTAPPAPLATGQPSRATYQAVLQQGKEIQGQIVGVSADSGTGITFNINFYDFPDVAENAPFGMFQNR